MIRTVLAGLAAAVLTAPLTATLTASPATAMPVWEESGQTWTTTAKTPRIVDLRYATHENYDRVVLDIKGWIPSGKTRYRKVFHYDGSGAEVPIKGKSGIALVLFPAYAHDDDGDSVYEGPMIARPKFETLKALAFTGDFEGYVSFGFALTHRAPHRVFWLKDPNRLVIDFKHE